MNFSLLIFLALVALSPFAAARNGTVVTVPFHSEILQDNRIGLSSERVFKVYLPPSYEENPEQTYPVLYYCHNFFWSPSQFFADGAVQSLLESAFAKSVVPEFILVVADYTSPTVGSLFENSATSGRWIDYTVQEVVPFIDQSYRTRPEASHRALAGDFMGGRGALYLAASFPEIFGSVYALHPVATGSGDLPWSAIAIDWNAIHEAESFSQLPEHGRERVFTAISQAFLPNENRPPFYCDFPVEITDGEARPHPANTRRAQSLFQIDELLDQQAAKLSQLDGIAFDWGRFDTTRAHVISNRRYSRLLADLGIEHEAEEYNGDPWNRVWTPDGRFATRVLPFLARMWEED